MKKFASTSVVVGNLYYIGKHEVTNAQYAEFLNAVTACLMYQITARPWGRLNGHSRGRLCHR